MNTPIVIFGYRRSKNLEVVLKKVSAVQPTNVYIFLDGSKGNEDKNDCKETQRVARKFLRHGWKLTISPKNNGLKESITAGLNMVFAKETKAIILEDDCVPDNSFFRYASELLKKYQNNLKIAAITGSNPVAQKSTNSYLFSNFFNGWGWATWRRAWKAFHPEKSIGEKEIVSLLNSHFPKDWFSRWYWQHILELTSTGIISTWDYLWQYHLWESNSLTIVPCVNLVQNTGFATGATNTHLAGTKLKQRALKINFPLNHPQNIKVNLKHENSRIKVSYRTPIAALGLIHQIMRSWIS